MGKGWGKNHKIDKKCSRPQKSDVPVGAQGVKGAVQFDGHIIGVIYICISKATSKNSISTTEAKYNYIINVRKKDIQFILS